MSVFTFVFSDGARQRIVFGSRHSLIQAECVRARFSVCTTIYTNKFPLFLFRL